MRERFNQSLCALFLLVAGVCNAQDVVHLVAEEDLNVAFQMADEVMADRHWDEAWVGYAVTRTMYRNSHMGWWGGGKDYPTLQALLNPADQQSGDEAVLAAARRALDSADQPSLLVQILVQKKVAFLFRRSGGTSSDLRVITLDSGMRLENRAIIWLGVREDGKSLAFLIAQHRTIPGQGELREELTTAIGMHDSYQETIPFLTRTARAARSGDVRDTARFWLANAIGQKLRLRAAQHEATAEFRIRKQALYALVHATDGDSIDMLVKLVQGNGDLEIRREALLQLGHSDDSGALDALILLAAS
ncbi:hypothetical protein JYT20_00280 [Rhodothermus sp. AH-315-K08]|nr:hypothetical protein [Rhodothermus sp. AH-315-K08]